MSRDPSKAKEKVKGKGFLLPSVNNASGLVSTASLSSFPQNYNNPLISTAASAGAFSPPATVSPGYSVGTLLGSASVIVPTATTSSILTSLPPRPAKLSEMDLLDTSITGSTDLSGEKKARIEHVRVSDSSTLETKYILGRKLGQGSFGTVRLGEDRATGITWAIKTIKKARGSTEKLEQLAREVAIMKRVKHPHIVQLKEVHETPNKIYLVMEYCRGGELVRRVAQKRYCSEHDCRIIMHRLLEAVAYLHDHGVVHRDLKPENVLLSMSDPNDQLNIKVSDFGLATFSAACKMMENICGTPFYMAPEIVANLGYSHQCDVWSLGVMLYLLLCGYRRECEHALQKMIALQKIVFEEPMNEEVSPAAKDLLQRMLKFDPAERITAREALQHPWINGKAEAPQSLGQTTVLQMMKSYNAERRLKRLFNVVLAAVRFQRGGVFGATNDDYDSDTSEDASLTAAVTADDHNSIPRSISAQSSAIPTSVADTSPPPAFDSDILGSSEVTACGTGSTPPPLVVAPTNTNRVKRPTTASRGSHRSIVRGYTTQHSTAATGTTISAKLLSPNHSAEEVADRPSPKRGSGQPVMQPISPNVMRTTSGDMESQVVSGTNALNVGDKPLVRSRRNSTPSTPTLGATPRRRQSQMRDSASTIGTTGSVATGSGSASSTRRRASSNVGSTANRTGATFSSQHATRKLPVTPTALSVSKRRTGNGGNASIEL